MKDITTLNTNMGITNEIKHPEILSTMVSTLDHMIAMLSNHCGPNAGFAVLPNTGRRESTFTMDGINILNELKFASPVEEFTREMITYVGYTVDKAATDGTTSSMMVTMVALKNLLHVFNTTHSKVPYNEILTEFDMFRDELTELIHKAAITKEKQTIKHLAYCQAMTSSHNDIELSEAVSEMFNTLPEDSWNHVAFEIEKYETDKRFRLVVEEDQYISKAGLFHPSMMKHDMGTKVILKDVDTMLLVEQVLHGQETCMKIEDMIKQYIAEKKPLCIVMNTGMCAHTRNVIEELLMDYKNHEITIIVISANDPTINDLTALQVLRGVHVDDWFTHLHTISKLDITFDSGNVHINKLYDNPDNLTVHPMVNHESETVLTDMLNKISETIESLKSEDRDTYSTNDVRRLQRIYNKLYLSRRVFVKIGGTAHDATAAIDSVTDTIGAVRCTLQNGASLGGMRTLYRLLEKYKGDTCKALFANAFRMAIKELNYVIYGKDKNSPDDILEDPKAYEAELLNSEFDFPTIAGSYITTFDDGKLNELVPIQPVVVETEILKRFGELALRFIRTKVVLLNGGFWDPNSSILI